MNSAISTQWYIILWVNMSSLFPPPFSPSANGPREGGLDTRGNHMAWPNLFRMKNIPRGKKKPNQHWANPRPIPGTVPNTQTRDKFNGDITGPANGAGGSTAAALGWRRWEPASQRWRCPSSVSSGHGHRHGDAASWGRGGQSDATRQSGIRAAF